MRPRASKTARVAEGHIGHRLTQSRCLFKVSRPRSVATRYCLSTYFCRKNAFGGLARPPSRILHLRGGWHVHPVPGGHANCPHAWPRRTAWPCHPAMPCLLKRVQEKAESELIIAQGLIAMAQNPVLRPGSPWPLHPAPRHSVRAPSNTSPAPGSGSGPPSRSRTWSPGAP